MSPDSILEEQIKSLPRPDAAAAKYLVEVELDDLVAFVARKVAEAERRGTAYAIKIVDELHFASHSDDDSIFKGIKNTIRDRYEMDTGIDPAPNYPIRVKLHRAANLDHQVQVNEDTDVLIKPNAGSDTDVTTRIKSVNEQRT